MDRPCKALDRARRHVDDAMIFVSLMVLAWPLEFGEWDDQTPNVVGVILPIVVVLVLGVVLSKLAKRFAFAQYTPVCAAVVLAAVMHSTGWEEEQNLTWLIIVMVSVVLLRQFLGARTNEGLMRDLTRERAILARQAFHDPLTELGNRALFMDHAQDALSDADETMTAVILFDLDGFKGVNDTYGHAAGDELLRVTAERLNANVRSNDTVSRLGGDEFVVLLPRLIDDQIADTVANRILRDLMQPLVVGDAVLSIRASAGIAITRGPGHDVDEILREADEALYQAKDDGKGVARRFDPARYAAAEQRRQQEADLRRALTEHQFEVFYQPIVDLDGEHTVGVEALIRWNHPERGLLPPAAFLDQVESLGLMPELGCWVLQEACRQAVAWHVDNPGFELNVNLSASQLGNPHLTDEVRAVLENTNMPPELLVLELTETVALTDLVESARVLSSLKTLGVRIALDDFGTGFSSLSHLGVLPVDVVKIDRSFVQAMPDHDGGSVAEAVLQIARTFGLSPVAEGVEDAGQASRLRALECTHAQGYHFAKPMPAAGLTALLSRQGSEPSARTQPVVAP
jgi:diguanylate cyclase (GGDEF)-like protein